MKKIRGQIVYSLEERLKRLSKLNTINGCIEWKSAFNHNGYGHLRIGSRTDKTRRSISAHRLAYKVFVGEIPDSLWVLHKCDNRACINPEHLFLGTRQDNVDDREKKGRNKIDLIRLRGENHHKSKLTWKDISLIRELKNKMTQKQIAHIFKVSREAIKKVLLNQTWSLAPTEGPQ